MWWTENSPKLQFCRCCVLKLQKNSNQSCPLLIILKSAFFRGLRVYELKFRSKKDNEIIFFQWKLRCCFFQICYPGGIQEASRNSILIWNFEIFQNFQKNAKFSNQNRASGGLLEASWVSDLEKATSQLSLKKKEQFILKIDDFKFSNLKSLKITDFSDKIRPPWWFKSSEKA